MIVGLTGLAGAGKDTAADFLIARGDFVRVALADPLKRICRDVFDFSDEQLWGASEKRNEPDLRYFMLRDDGSAYGYLSPRHALQQLGTEWGRACHPDVWIDYALRVADEVRRGQAYTARRGLYSTSPGTVRCPHAVISDVRFENEAAKIRAKGGLVWQITRAGAGLSGAAALHVSEAGVPVALIDRVIPNDGDLEALRLAVAGAIRTELL